MKITHISFLREIVKLTRSKIINQVLSGIITMI